MHEPDADRDDQQEAAPDVPRDETAQAQRRAWRAAAAAEASYLLSVRAR
jgi:hypothetical protein